MSGKICGTVKNVHPGIIVTPISRPLQSIFLSGNSDRRKFSRDNPPKENKKSRALALKLVDDGAWEFQGDLQEPKSQGGEGHGEEWLSNISMCSLRRGFLHSQGLEDQQSRMGGRGTSFRPGMKSHLCRASRELCPETSRSLLGSPKISWQSPTTAKDASQICQRALVVTEAEGL